jgi:eukaryotic-like serine/threonine-protein kinase
MGVVYEAVDRQLDRTVAVKVLRPELAADARFLARFRREARTSARLSHPGIVAVHDVGTDQGRAFIVMELVPGRTIGELAREDGPLDPGRIARLGMGVAQALAHAHARGVVHRDISPGNLMVTPSDEIKVLDFGIARASRGSASATPGSARGTLAYVAPEQLRGDAPDHRADIYSVGVVLAELLERGDRVPPRLAAAVRRCTGRDPVARFNDAGELAEELWRCALAAPAPPERPVRIALEGSTATTAPVRIEQTRRLRADHGHGSARASSGRARRASRAFATLALLAAAVGAAFVVGPAIASFTDDLSPHVQAPHRVRAPTGLTATATCDGFFATGVDLSWAPGGPSTGYQVWRQGGSEDRATLVAKIDDPDVTTYRDIDLGVDTSYAYTVKAVDGMRISRPSDAAETGTPLLCLT